MLGHLFSYLLDVYKKVMLMVLTIAGYVIHDNLHLGTLLHVPALKDASSRHSLCDLMTVRWLVLLIIHLCGIRICSALTGMVWTRQKGVLNVRTRQNIGNNIAVAQVYFYIPLYLISGQIGVISALSGSSAYMKPYATAIPTGRNGNSSTRSY